MLEILEMYWSNALPRQRHPVAIVIAASPQLEHCREAHDVYTWDLGGRKPTTHMKGEN
jgi:hypothetical protein